MGNRPIAAARSTTSKGAEARLERDQIPGDSATAEDPRALIAQIRAQPRTLRTQAALRVLDRQLAYLEAREDLAMKHKAQSEAREFAARGKVLGASVRAVLAEKC